MLFAVVIKKTKLFVFMSLIALSVIAVVFYTSLLEKSAPSVFNYDDMLQFIEQTFEMRDKALLRNAPDIMECLYNTETSNGAWAYKNESKRIKYLHKWVDKQGAKFVQVNSRIKVTRAKASEAEYAFNLICSTEYGYTYENDLDTTNLFRIVTYHYIIMKEKENKWLITKEWYLDPFEYSLHEYELGTGETRNYILSGKPRNFSKLAPERLQAVEYADRYCGASGNEEYGFLYNSKYQNYNGIGGDCTNFISQVLYEGGKFRKSGIWNYDNGGSDAWVRAEAFKDFMLGSGRASLIAYGTYDEVFKAAYKLEPGDLISYKRGRRIEHTAVVTGTDSKGYALINCHTTDGYRVPWDLGWNSKDVKFYLMKVNY